MIGMDRTTGRKIDGIAHLKQSITDILTTPIGSRVMRRDYGSRIFELLDAPLNRSGIVDIYAATVEALNRWEPRLKIDSVESEIVEGSIILTIFGDYLPTGEAIKLDGIKL